MTKTRIQKAVSLYLEQELYQIFRAAWLNEQLNGKTCSFSEFMIDLAREGLDVRKLNVEN